MSRRASFFARTHPGQRRVRFPDEIVFHESVKESDGEAVIRMLRRVSVDIDINRINMSGMTALHQVMEQLYATTLSQHYACQLVLMYEDFIQSWT